MNVTAEILDFDRERRERQDRRVTGGQVISTDPSSPGKVRAVSNVSGETSSRTAAIATGADKKTANIDDLYVWDLPGARMMNRVRQILSDGIEHLHSALMFLGSDDAIGADNEINAFQAEIPEMFLCRSVSEGVSAGSIAMFHALRNRGGETLNANQIWALMTLAKKLHTNTFSNLDQILDEVDALLDVGFKIDPKDAEAMEPILAV